MKKIDYKSPEMVNTSADVLGCRFDIYEILFAIVTGAGAAALRLLFDPVGVAITECTLGGLYGMGLFLIFKTLLPFFLYTRVIDVVRYRFAFYALCSTGVVAVMQSPCFRLAFAHAGAPAYVRLIALFAVLFAIFTVWTGSRGFLSLICLVCGALVAYKPLGLLSALAVWAIFVFYRMRLHYAHEVMGVDADYAYGGAYIKVAKQLSRNLGRISTNRITGGLLFFFGVAVMLAVNFYLNRGGLSTSEWLKSMAFGYLAELKEIAAAQTLVRTVVGIVATVLAMAFVRSATDVLVPLPSHLMVLYFILFVGSLGWAIGLPELVPFLAAPETISTGMQVADIAMAGVLILSSSVFLVEVCCRSPETLDSFEGFDDDDMVEKASQMNRNVRAFFLSAFILAAVVLVPYVLMRLHFKLLY